MLATRRTFLKQFSVGIASISVATSIPPHLLAGTWKAHALPRSTPELQGISSQHILAFVDAVEKDKLGLHSIMVVRHGKVVAEGWWDPYKPDLKHTMFSLSKSFTSTAIGFAVKEGRLKVEDKVISFFPEDKPQQVSENLAAMRVKDLLTMTSGHDKDTMPPLRKEKQGGWAKKFLSLPVEHKPGTFFLYNTGASYMLSAIIQKLTGQTLLDYLKPRFLDPLGIEGADWETDPEGINTGGYGLRIKTEDIAKFGQFYLQKGVWNDKRLLPEAWIKEATAFQVSNESLTAKNPESDWQQGYGYQFWRCRHDIYRGDGAVGQFCIVMPAQDAVIAITSETADMQAIMNGVWKHLLPAMESKPLMPNSRAHDALTRKLASLTLLPTKITVSSPMVANISGKSYKLQENSMQAQAVTFTFSKNTCTFTLKDNIGEYSIACGLGQWAKGETRMPGEPPKFIPNDNKEISKAKVAASGNWQDENTFVMTWIFFETPHSDTVTCHFAKDTLRLEYISSILGKRGDFKEKRPVLEGHLLV